MKILICGSGSIATRHYKNLIKIGYKDIIFYKSTKYLKKNSIIKNKKIYYNLKEALREKPNISFICNVTNMHVDTAIKCAQKKCHIFMEKPISNNFKNINKLKQILKKNKLVFFVGYMMKFHPLIKKIKSIVNNNKSKNFFYASTIWGEFLPHWHPEENYKKSYAANKNQGGGVTLTLSHELDLMIYLFGKIKSLVNKKQFKSKLKINADVASTYLIQFLSGVDCNIHVNYLCNPPVRELVILGENIQINFNYYLSTLIVNEKNKIRKYSVKKFDRNQLFEEELKNFFKIIKNKKKFNLESEFYSLSYLLK